MELENQFEEAVRKSKTLPDQDDSTLLDIYSLYKQATIGDVNIERPANPFDIAGMAKYNAWKKREGLSKEEAMQKYIDLIDELGKA